MKTSTFLTTLIIIVAAGTVYGLYMYEDGEAFDGSGEVPIDVELEGNYLEYDLTGKIGRGAFVSTFMKGDVTLTYVSANTDRNAYLMAQEIEYTLKESNPYDSSKRSDYEIETYWTDEVESHDWHFTYHGNVSGYERATCVEDSYDDYRFNGESITCSAIFTTYAHEENPDIKVTEIQYVGITKDDYWIAYFIKHIEEDTSSIGLKNTRMTCEFELKSHGTGGTISGEGEVVVYSEKGVKTSGGGKTGAGEDVLLSASVDEGYVFKGWFSSSMKLLSEDADYSFTVGIGEDIVYALTTAEPVWVYENKEADMSCALGLDPSTVADGEWSVLTEKGKVVDTMGYGSMTVSLKEVGTYYLRLCGTDHNGDRITAITHVIADGVIEKTYSWRYGGATYSTSLDITYSDYLAFADNDEYDADYRSNTKYSPRGSEHAEHARGFVNTKLTNDDRYVKELAKDLMGLTVNWNQQDRADFVLSFVQDSITYESDSKNYGEQEWWTFPLETLYMGSGDCEDSSFLFCAIMNEMTYGGERYDVAMFLMDGHMAAGVGLSDFECKSFWDPKIAQGIHGWDAKGKALDGASGRYYYCETTGAGWFIGDIPLEMVDDLLAVVQLKG